MRWFNKRWKRICLIWAPPVWLWLNFHWMQQSTIFNLMLLVHHKGSSVKGDVWDVTAVFVVFSFSKSTGNLHAFLLDFSFPKFSLHTLLLCISSYNVHLYKFWDYEHNFKYFFVFAYITWTRIFFCYGLIKQWIIFLQFRKHCNFLFYQNIT